MVIQNLSVETTMTSQTISLADIGESTTDFGSTSLNGSIVSFHDINYAVNVRSMPCSKPKKKVILQNMRFDLYVR